MIHQVCLVGDCSPTQIQKHICASMAAVGWKACCTPPPTPRRVLTSFLFGLARNLTLS